MVTKLRKARVSIKKNYLHFPQGCDFKSGQICVASSVSTSENGVSAVMGSVDFN